MTYCTAIILGMSRVRILKYLKKNHLKLGDIQNVTDLTDFWYTFCLINITFFFL